jgi:hypothetical protein
MGPPRRPASGPGASRVTLEPLVRAPPPPGCAAPRQWLQRGFLWGLPRPPPPAASASPTPPRPPRPRLPPPRPPRPRSPRQQAPTHAWASVARRPPPRPRRPPRCAPRQPRQLRRHRLPRHPPLRQQQQQQRARSAPERRGGQRGACLARSSGFVRSSGFERRWGAREPTCTVCEISEGSHSCPPPRVTPRPALHAGRAGGRGGRGRHRSRCLAEVVGRVWPEPCWGCLPRGRRTRVPRARRRPQPPARLLRLSAAPAPHPAAPRAPARVCTCGVGRILEPLVEKGRGGWALEPLSRGRDSPRGPSRRGARGGRGPPRPERPTRFLVPPRVWRSARESRASGRRGRRPPARGLRC